MEERNAFLKRNKYDGQIVVPYRQTRNEGGIVTYKANFNSKKAAQRELTPKQKRIIRDVAIGTAAGLMLFGSVAKYIDYKDSKNTITLEQALDSGKTLNSLGLDEELRARLQKLENNANEKLTNTDMIEMASSIVRVQQDVVKSKLADVLNVEEATIQLMPPIDGESAYILVDGQGMYERASLFSGIMGEKTISGDISEFIETIVDMQGLEDEVQTQDLDREKIIKEYQKNIKETSKFAAGEMSLTKNGSVKMDKTRVSELKKIQEDKERE